MVEGDESAIQPEVPVNLFLGEGLHLAGHGIYVSSAEGDPLKHWVLRAGQHQADPGGEELPAPERVVQMACHMSVSYDKDGITSIDVRGVNADDVRDVTRSLVGDLETRRREQAALRSPWFSGLFYLAALCVVVSLLLAVGRVLPIWSLPAVVVAAAVLVPVVGALQMRQDDRLSERGFLTLMGDVFRSLPTLASRSSMRAPAPVPSPENPDQ
ncbi:hypothetical protein [Nocardia asteroides]|uniref:hypothetical protein n=1 Tax=Nocardia asteroides TaxID=1824 RepID=UPI00340AB31D